MNALYMSLNSSRLLVSHMGESERSSGDGVLVRPAGLLCPSLPLSVVHGGVLVFSTALGDPWQRPSLLYCTVLVCIVLISYEYSLIIKIKGVEKVNSMIELTVEDANGCPRPWLAKSSYVYE